VGRAGIKKVLSDNRCLQACLLILVAVLRTRGAAIFINEDYDHCQRRSVSIWDLHEISLSRLHPDTSEYKDVRVGKNMNRTRFRFLEVGSITVSPALRRYCVEDSQLDNSDNSDSLLEDSDIDADNNIKLPWPLHIVLMRVLRQVGIRSRPYPWGRGGPAVPQPGCGAEVQCLRISTSAASGEMLFRLLKN
jgi:hypothetical protein